jgi:hypothetical protein
MGKVEISKTKDDVFGNMISLSNGIVSLTASLDFGPRIMSFNLNGMENMLYNDPEKKPINNAVYHEFNKEDVLKVYGGHRLWISPEILPRCYYPDNDPVDCEIRSNGVILQAPVETFNGIQKSVEIWLNEFNAEVLVVNNIKNTGAWNIVFAPWAITVMAAGGTLVVPHADNDTGLLSNRFVGLWPYSKMNDKRVYWGDKYIILRQDTSETSAFKFGTNNEKGWAAYFNKKQLFVKTYPHVHDGVYPDFAGCSFEAYTNEHFLEIESLGHSDVVPPHSTVTHMEKWTLFKEGFVPELNEEKITAVINKYLDD